jgi:Holliday junction resolvase-like predicted endonuclease
MEIGIWKITASRPQPYQPGLIARESQLEDWIEQNPAMLSPGLSIVGRQLVVSAGRLDLLALDDFGRWTVVEIKRGEVRRETIMQAVDYAASIDQMDSLELERHVDAYLKTKGGSLKQHFKEHKLDRTIFDERNPLIYVVGTIRDPHLDRIAAYLTTRGNLVINVVNFDIYENEQGEQIIVRQLTALETGTDARPVRASTDLEFPDLASLAPASPAPPPTADADLQRLFKLADKNGIGPEFRVVYEQATRHGLYPRLYKWSIMYAPPTNKTRVLIFTPAKRNRGEFNLYFAANAFAEFYPVREREVVQLVWDKGNYAPTLDELKAFFINLDKLFALIEKNKK